MQEYDLLSEAFGITFQFLNQAEKCFAGVHRVKENSFGAGNFAYKLERFGL